MTTSTVPRETAAEVTRPFTGAERHELEARLAAEPLFASIDRSIVLRNAAHDGEYLSEQEIAARIAEQHARDRAITRQANVRFALALIGGRA